MLFESFATRSLQLSNRIVIGAVSNTSTDAGAGPSVRYLTDLIPFKRHSETRLDILKKLHKEIVQTEYDVMASPKRLSSVYAK
jgi:hypothetical protein